MRTLSHAPTKRRRGTRRLMVGGGLTEMRLDVLDAKRFVGSSWNLLTERGSFDHSFPFSSLLLTTEKRFREMPSIRLFIPFSIPFSWFSNTRERHIHTFHIPLPIHPPNPRECLLISADIAVVSAPGKHRSSIVHRLRRALPGKLRRCRSSSRGQ